MRDGAKEGDALGEVTPFKVPATSQTTEDGADPF